MYGLEMHIYIYIKSDDFPPNPEFSLYSFRHVLIYKKENRFISQQSFKSKGDYW